MWETRKSESSEKLMCTQCFEMYTDEKNEDWHDHASAKTRSYIILHQIKWLSEWKRNSSYWIWRVAYSFEANEKKLWNLWNINHLAT